MSSDVISQVFEVGNGDNSVAVAERCLSEVGLAPLKVHYTYLVFKKSIGRLIFTEATASPASMLATPLTARGMLTETIIYACFTYVWLRHQ